MLIVKRSFTTGKAAPARATYWSGTEFSRREAKAGFPERPSPTMIDGVPLVSRGLARYEPDPKKVTGLSRLYPWKSNRTPQPPSPGWIDWSTAFDTLFVPLISGYSSRTRYAPVGALNPTAAETFPRACLTGSRSQKRASALTSPMPLALCSRRGPSGVWAGSGTDHEAFTTGMLPKTLNLGPKVYDAAMSNNCWVLST